LIRILNLREPSSNRYIHTITATTPFFTLRLIPLKKIHGTPTVLLPGGVENGWLNVLVVEKVAEPGNT